MTDWSLPNNPGGLQNGASFPNDADDVLANDQAMSVAGSTHEAATNGVHGVSSGAVVGTEATQSLSNKTLVSPKLTSPGSITDESGNEYLKLVKSASAVNELTVTSAATGSAPKVSATGDDTNISLALAPKGTGDIQLETPTGNSAEVTATGVDSNIDIRLNPKGTGVVRSGAIKLLREDGHTVDTDAGSEALADTQASFTDVDTTNASVTFTVNAVGQYIALFSFNGQLSGSGTESLRLAFRLTDGTNSSTPVMAGATNIAGNIWMPFTLFHVFTFATTGSKTVKLQYRSSGGDADSGFAFNDGSGLTTGCSMSVFRVAD